MQEGPEQHVMQGVKHESAAAAGGAHTWFLCHSHFANVLL